eukprot:168655-Chlamydomonas_euryale.AAC.6
MFLRCVVSLSGCDRPGVPPLLLGCRVHALLPPTVWRELQRSAPAATPPLFSRSSELPSACCECGLPGGVPLCRDALLPTCCTPYSGSDAAQRSGYPGCGMLLGAPHATPPKWPCECRPVCMSKPPCGSTPPPSSMLLSGPECGPVCRGGTDDSDCSSRAWLLYWPLYCNMAGCSASRRMLSGRGMLAC